MGCPNSWIPIIYNFSISHPTIKKSNFDFINYYSGRPNVEGNWLIYEVRIWRLRHVSFIYLDATLPMFRFFSSPNCALFSSFKRWWSGPLIFGWLSFEICMVGLEFSALVYLFSFLNAFRSWGIIGSGFLLVYGYTEDHGVRHIDFFQSLLAFIAL